MSFRVLSVTAVAAALLFGGASMMPSQQAEAAKKVCKTNFVVGKGVGHGVLGAGTKKARIRAIAAWQRTVAARYGSSWSRWTKATETDVECDRNLARAVCTATARPCK